MLEPQRDHCFLNFGANAASAAGRLTGEEKLRGLLGEGRPSFDDPSRAHVAPQRANDANRIDTRMRPVAVVLGGNGRRSKDWRNGVRAHRHAAHAAIAAGFVKRRALTIDDERRGNVPAIEQSVRERGAAQPKTCAQRSGREAKREAPSVDAKQVPKRSASLT